MATDRTSVSTIKEVAPVLGGGKCITIETSTATVATDTVAITLANYGMVAFLGHQSYVHTTDLSVVVTEAATTAVSNGVLTVTFPSGNDSKRRFVVVWGR